MQSHLVRIIDCNLINYLLLFLNEQIGLLHVRGLFDSLEFRPRQMSIHLWSDPIKDHLMINNIKLMLHVIATISFDIFKNHAY